MFAVLHGSAIVLCACPVIMPARSAPGAASEVDDRPAAATSVPPPNDEWRH
jgi:hypothetical protein